MSTNEVTDVLEGITQASAVIGSALPGPGGVAARIVSLVMGAATSFVKMGKDPEIEIERILSAEPLLQRVHDEWNKAIEDKFGLQSAPPAVTSAPDTVAAPSSADPYEDI